MLTIQAKVNLSVKDIISAFSQLSIRDKLLIRDFIERESKLWELSKQEKETNLKNLLSELDYLLSQTLCLYDNIEQRNNYFYQFKDMLLSLWTLSERKEDAYRQLITILEDTTKYLHGEDITPEQLEALSLVIKKLKNEKVEVQDLADLDSALYQAGLNTIPPVPECSNYLSLMKEIFSA
ncbi:hypothetical protein FJZ31_14160 [Candidatus Poribacteria bacterium]|nr:hypothetical protein [Candidatus Poribacteria bacterium]